MFTMPRMVFDWSVKNRATSLGLIPGTGMNVPMRYTTRAPTRNSRRPRISPKRAASPKPAAGLLNVELATRVLLYVGLQLPNVKAQALPFGPAPASAALAALAMALAALA